MKSRPLAFTAVILSLFIITTCIAVDTRAIDQVRNKGVLDSQDFSTIEKFLSKAVGELLNSKDFTSTAKTRTIILSRKNSDKPSDQNQYAQQFSESAYKEISRALEAAEQLTPDDRKFKAVLNLLILIDGLENVRVSSLAIDMLDDPSKVIRYWAVRCVTEMTIVEKLNSKEDGNPELAGKIAEKLEEISEQASSEMLGPIARFAAWIKVPQGRQLLLKLTDKRIKDYQQWSVEYELFEAELLKLLCNKIAASKNPDAEIARRFAQLYSYTIQRYIKGRNILSENQQQQLISVMVEVERACVGEILGPHLSITTAVKNNDYGQLFAEHDKLLGDKTSAGTLAEKLRFDYGSNSSEKQTAPLTLPEPPK